MILKLSNQGNEIYYFDRWEYDENGNETLHEYGWVDSLEEEDLIPTYRYLYSYLEGYPSILTLIAKYEWVGDEFVMTEREEAEYDANVHATSVRIYSYEDDTLYICREETYAYREDGKITLEASVYYNLAGEVTYSESIQATYDEMGFLVEIKEIRDNEVYELETYEYDGTKVIYSDFGEDGEIVMRITSEYASIEAAKEFENPLAESYDIYDITGTYIANKMEVQYEYDAFGNQLRIAVDCYFLNEGGDFEYVYSEVYLATYVEIFPDEEEQSENLFA